MATDPNFAVQFHASDMIIKTDNDASYLTEPQAHSYAAVYLFLVRIPSKCAREHLNDPVHKN